MKAKLILVEGTAGSGKSTTSQWLNLTLGRTSPTAWYPEDGAPGGLRCYYDPNEQTVEQYANALVSRWTDFLTEAAFQEGTWIVESALLQSPIHGLLLGDTDRATIEGIVDRIFRALSLVEPCLIYLRTDDPGGTLRRACRSRYEGLLEEYVRRIESSRFGIRHRLSGFGGLSEFWERFANISDGCVERFEGSKVVVRTPGEDREAARRAIGDFLASSGFVWPATPISPVDAEASRYAGTYARKLGHQTAEVEIRVGGGELTIFGMAPFLWDAGERLIPKEPNVFAAASWPTEVHFHDRDGAITGFQLVTIPGGRATDEIFPRLGNPSGRRDSLSPS